jgi:hypothetical protein
VGARRARVPRQGTLDRLEDVDVEDGLMGGGVHVRTVSELPQVDAVPQHPAYARGGHSQAPGDLRHGYAGEYVLRGPPNLVGVGAWHEAARGADVPPIHGRPGEPVAARDLPLSPHPSGDRGRAALGVALCVLLALADSLGDEHVPDETARDGARVGVLGGGVNMPARGLNALPDQVPVSRAREPLDVRHDDAGVPARLYAFDCGQERRASFDREPA